MRKKRTSLYSRTLICKVQLAKVERGGHIAIVLDLIISM